MNGCQEVPSSPLGKLNLTPAIHEFPVARESSKGSFYEFDIVSFQKLIIAYLFPRIRINSFEI